MLIGAEDKYFIFLDGATDVEGVIMQIDARIGFARRQENSAGDGVGRTADEIKFAVQIVGSGIRNDVEDVTGGLAEFGGEAVRDGLDLAHVYVRDGKQAQTI